MLTSQIHYALSGDVINLIERCHYGQRQCVANLLQRFLLKALHRLIAFMQAQFYSDMISHYVIISPLSDGILQQMHGNFVIKVDQDPNIHMHLLNNRV